MKNKLAVAIHAAIPFILLSTSIQANAEETQQASAETGLELSITANRRVESLDKTLASVSVITRNDIEKLQATDLVEVLQTQRGINISRNGGSGSNTSVFIRGSESDQVLVILDGVRVSSATTGAFNWASLPITQIERVEIVRGPRAALYGSDAIGGVIEISTRKKAGTFVSVTAGKYNTKGISAGLSGGDRTKFSIGFSNEKSSSFSAQNSDSGAFFDPDKDPYQRESLNLSVSHQLNDKIKAGVQLFGSENDADYDNGNSVSKLITTSAHLEADMNDSWSHKLTIANTKNKSTSTSAFGESKFDTKRSELNWQNNVTLNSSTSLIVGANHRQDNGTSKDYDETVKNTALYANLNKKLGGLNLDASLRFDDHNVVGNKTTGQIAAGYSFGKFTPYASFGTAFKAPTINELYYPGFANFTTGDLEYAGNEDLEPETSSTFELGVKARISNNQRFEASVFNTEVENLISFTGVNKQAVNVNEATMKGLELGYSGDLGSFDWNTGLTLLRTEDKSTGERLVRRPDKKIDLNLGYTFARKTRLGMDASLVGTRDDNDFSTFPSSRKELDKYTLLNLSLNHKLTKHIGLGVRLDNVTDEDYQIANGYNTPGRGAYFTVSYQ